MYFYKLLVVFCPVVYKFYLFIFWNLYNGPIVIFLLTITKY